MGKRTEHAPGTFSWVDLQTSDTEAAKSFYADVFGWQYEDNEIPESEGGGVYTMCIVDGAQVCAISGLPPGQEQIPPHWNSYVTVEDADATAAKAKELGGNAILDVFDVMTAGRMVVLTDPTGAAFCLWQPKDQIGAQLVNAPGALTWNELHTTDIPAAIEFYTGLFGWTPEKMNGGGDGPVDGPEYHVIRNGERSNGGVMPTQEGEPPNWMPYFAVESLDDAISKTTGGGNKLAGPIDFPQGRIAVIQDPQAAVFGLWEGQLDD